MRDGERLLVVRLGAMGDIVHTLPAVASVRRAFPHAHIGWVVEERWRELLCAEGAPLAGERSAQRPLVDAVHVANTFAWRIAPFSDETWREALDLRRELRRKSYDVAVDWQGAMKSALLARLSGAATVVGFLEPRESAARMFYTRAIAAQGRHVVEQNLSLAQALGAEPIIKFDFPLDVAAERWAEAELARLGLRDFAILNPGAGWGAKRWPVENYAEVARELGARGLPSLINHGPGEEALARRVFEMSQGAARTITCAVGELIALTRRARLFIGGDTGPMHLAAALGIPVVAIFGPTDPARNGPYSQRAMVLRSPESPTTHARRSQPDTGLLSITPAQVTAAAELLLSQEQA